MICKNERIWSCWGGTRRKLLYVDPPLPLDLEICYISNLIHLSIPDNEENVQRYPLARHVLHIGIDGLRPDCMPNATSGLPNMLRRLAHQGTYTLERARTVLWYCNLSQNKCPGRTCLAIVMKLCSLRILFKVAS